MNAAFSHSLGRKRPVKIFGFKEFKGSEYISLHSKYSDPNFAFSLRFQKMNLSTTALPPEPAAEVILTLWPASEPERTWVAVPNVLSSRCRHGVFRCLVLDGKMLLN